MPRYSIEELIARANAGNIGRKGIHRLLSAGLDPGEMGASGVASPVKVDLNAELAARRAALYERAVTAAHGLQPGQTLSAGLQRRLELGAGSAAPLAPRSVAGVQAYQGGNYDTILAALRKKRQGINSQAGIYRF